MTEIYILVCVGKGKHEYKGRPIPIAATFGAYKSMAEANKARERIISSEENHFADDVEWIISIDNLY